AVRADNAEDAGRRAVAARERLRRVGVEFEPGIGAAGRQIVLDVDVVNGAADIVDGIDRRRARIGDNGVVVAGNGSAEFGQVQIARIEVERNRLALAVGERLRPADAAARLQLAD